MKKGIFITMEGPDGSGKSTIAALLVEWLIGMNYEVVHTREPGGVTIAEKIRDIILDPQNTEMDAKTEALLYAASRRQHLVEKVIPSLNEGKIVLCERFLDSSIAYQGYGRQLGQDDILAINHFAIGDAMPDVTLYLNIDEQSGLDRLKDRHFKDRLDVESLAFHSRVVEGYKQVVRSFPERIRVVDASLSVEEVFATCQNILKEVLDARQL